MPNQQILQMQTHSQYLQKDPYKPQYGFEYCEPPRARWAELWVRDALGLVRIDPQTGRVSAILNSPYQLCMEIKEGATWRRIRYSDRTPDYWIRGPILKLAFPALSSAWIFVKFVRFNIRPMFFGNFRTHCVSDLSTDGFRPHNTVRPFLSALISSNWHFRPHY